MDTDPITPVGKKRRRDSNERSKPTKTIIYILGWKPRTGRMRYRTQSLHTQRSEMAYDFFKELVVHDELIAKDFKKADEYNDWVKSDLTRHPPGTMAVFYLETSLAGLNGQEWGFYLKDGSLERVNLHDYVQVLIDSGLHCVYLHDGFIAERFRDQWKTPDQSSYVEISSRGELMQVTDKERITDEDGFSECMFEDLDNYMANISTTFARRKTPFSIPDLLATNKHMSYNIRRKWTDGDKTHHKGDKIVERCLLVPGDIRETGKIQFFSVRIQGPPKKARLSTGDYQPPVHVDDAGNVQIEDEGIFMEEEEIRPGQQHTEPTD